MSEPASPPSAERKLVYIADPMCSWCYGFSPAINALAAQFEGRLPVKLIMGGLRAGNTVAMRPQDKDYIRGAWEKVTAASGQPFDFSFFERDGFVYDTEPACRAVVAMRALHPEKALAFMGEISTAFYAGGRDTTGAEELCDVAAAMGADPEAFRQTFLSPDIRNETMRDFLTAQEIGVQGFPTLIAGSDAAGYAVVTNGFNKIENLAEPLERWYATTAAA